MFPRIAQFVSVGLERLVQYKPPPCGAVHSLILQFLRVGEAELAQKTPPPYAPPGLPEVTLPFRTVMPSTAASGGSPPWK